MAKPSWHNCTTKESIRKTGKGEVEEAKMCFLVSSNKVPQRFPDGSSPTTTSWKQKPLAFRFQFPLFGKSQSQNQLESLVEWSDVFLLFPKCFEANQKNQTSKFSSALQFSFQASLSCFSCFSFVFFPNVDEQKRSVLSRRTPTPSSRREVFSLLLGSWKKIGISHSRRRRRQRKNL